MLYDESDPEHFQQRGMEDSNLNGLMNDTAMSWKVFLTQDESIPVWRGRTPIFSPGGGTGTKHLFLEGSNAFRQKRKGCKLLDLLLNFCAIFFGT